PRTPEQRLCHLAAHPALLLLGRLIPILRLLLLRRFLLRLLRGWFCFSFFASPLSVHVIGDVHQGNEVGGIAACSPKLTAVSERPEEKTESNERIEGR